MMIHEWGQINFGSAFLELFLPKTVELRNLKHNKIFQIFKIRLKTRAQ